MKNILVITKGTQGVPYFRSVAPHLNLQKNYKDDLHITIKQDGNLSMEDMIGYDIVHFHRDILKHTFQSFTTLVDNLHSNGTKVIMDLDDHYDLPNRHPMYHAAKHNKMKDQIIHNLKTVDHVTTTTDYFSKKLSVYNSVTVLENGIDVSEDQFIPNNNISEKVRFGYIAGSSHKEDIKLISQLPIEIKKLNAQLVFCGFDIRGNKTIIDSESNKAKQIPFEPHETISYFYEKILTSNFNNISDNYKKHLHKFIKDLQYDDVNNELYRREWTKSINSYATHYNNIDVSLAPLINDEFNKVKSQLKVIESGFFKKPIIASNIIPYQIDIIDGFNGFLIDYKKPKLWNKAVKKLMDKDLREEMGNNLYNSVKEKYLLDNINKKRFELYNKI